MKLARDKELALLGSLACVGAGSRSVGVHHRQMQFRPVRITISAWPLASLVNDHS